MDHTHLTPAGGMVARCDDEPACSVVRCSVCLAEIPPDSAKTADVQDYVQYFCGLECLAVWRERARREASAKSA